MPFFRAFSVLPPVLLSLPLVLLATGLWAAHHEHPAATDLAIQAMLLLFMAALLVNVIISVVAILCERDPSDLAEHRGNQSASELEPPRPVRAAPATSQAPSDAVTAKQALSEP